MILSDFKNMLGIDGRNIKEEMCCCAKSASNLYAAKKAVEALNYDDKMAKNYLTVLIACKMVNMKNE